MYTDSYYTLSFCRINSLSIFISLLYLQLFFLFLQYDAMENGHFFRTYNPLTITHRHQVLKKYQLLQNTNKIFQKIERELQLLEKCTFLTVPIRLHDIGFLITLSIEGGLKSMELLVSVPSRDLEGVSGLMRDWSPDTDPPNIMLDRVAGVLHRVDKAFRAP